jgi:hypothetical protein
MEVLSPRYVSNGDTRYEIIFVVGKFVLQARRLVIVGLAPFLYGHGGPSLLCNPCRVNMMCSPEEFVCASKGVGRFDANTASSQQFG